MTLKVVVVNAAGVRKIVELNPSRSLVLSEGETLILPRSLPQSALRAEDGRLLINDAELGNYSIAHGKDATVLLEGTGPMDLGALKSIPPPDTLAANTVLPEAAAGAGGASSWGLGALGFWSLGLGAFGLQFADTVRGRGRLGDTAGNDSPDILSNGGGANATLAVPENGTSATTVSAFDPDAGNTLSYSIVGGADSARFAIDSASGALSFIAAPNFENPTDAGADNVYNVIVQVSDGTLTDSQALAITVTNVNEAPELGGVIGLATATLPESTTAVGTFLASDPDAGNTLSYTLTGADAGLFAYDSATGALSFITAPDFEQRSTYNVGIQASDGTLSDSLGVLVVVLNTNETPVITSNGGGDSAAVTLPENGTGVTTVVAADPDTNAALGTLSYSIVGGADGARFDIDSASGVLRFNAAPNFESPADAGANNVYDVVVQVSDGTLTDTQALAVTIADINEAPAFAGAGLATSAVPENTTAVGTFLASDPDAGNVLSYTLTGPDAGLFTYDPATGALSFITAPDFEQRSIYAVRIEASDGTLSGSDGAFIVVSNVNEAPVITSNGGGNIATIAVPEDTTELVTTIMASDPDANANLVYSLSPGLDGGRFTINPSTGALRFISPPDFENPTDLGGNNVYDISVGVSDGLLSDSQTIVVTVLDVDGAPTITSNGGGNNAAVSVAENTTFVTTVIAVDPGAGSPPVYSITGGADAALFAINSSTGALSFVAAPDFEAPTDAGPNNVYNLIVGAGDGSLTDTQALAVTVTNVNEAPVISSNGGGNSAAVSVAENSTAVTTVVAADPDAGSSVGYSITGGLDAARFTINASTGALSFITTPSFENPTDVGANNVYDVIVSAGDGSLSDSQALAVTVTNLNEAPVINSNGGGNAASVSIPENSSGVALVSAIDPDAGSSLVFSLAGGADSARFAIDSASGALSFITAPDFENPADAGADNVYNVVVQVSDGSLTDSQALAVTVTDVDETAPNQAPVITSFSGNNQVLVDTLENSASVPLQVTATDPNPGNTLVFSLGGPDAARFTLDANSGLLTFQGNANFEAPTDLDGNNRYEVVVTVSDGSLTDSQAFAVTVGNVNEAPVIGSNGGGATASVPVSENSTAVTTVVATDPDIGTALGYSISGGADAARFTINAGSGVLAFIAAPDFENPTDAGSDNVYDVTVQVSDGSLTDSQAIAVMVTNANEAPVITSNGGGDTGAVSVAENSTAVTTVVATDPDAGTSLGYSISGGADAARFTIDAGSGALAFTMPPNFEAPNDSGSDNVYDVTVQVSDGSLTDSQALAVTVTDVDETPPNQAPFIISNGGGDTAAVSVAENTTAVTTVAAVDGDTSDIPRYSITGGADAALFSINEATGMLRFVAAPDFETPQDAGTDNVYNVVVSAGDGSLTDSQAIAVTVTDVSNEFSLGSVLELSSLNGSNGLRINGESATDFSGYSVASAGDINGDGFDDVIIGAPGVDFGASNFGAAWVVFGTAGALPAALNLSALDGSNGFQLNGIAAGDNAGNSVGAVGDFNGDGIDDLVIGAPAADPNGSESGAAYVVFGSTSGFGSSFNLSALNGSNGFRINGEAATARAGDSVASAGDLNGDGFDDLIIGASRADRVGATNAGAAFVIFGTSASGLAPVLELSALNGSNGFEILGAVLGDYAGESVASAGDLNGDGFDDLIIGGPRSDPNDPNSGAGYVIFGSAAPAASSLNLNSATNLFLHGQTSNNFAGQSVAPGGDFNGDGFADLLIGAQGAAPNGSNSGASYLVFGSATGLPAVIELSALDGSNGFRISGESMSDFSGFSVFSAGDVNGDGFDDLVVGAYRSDANGTDSGAAYVIFGRATGSSSALELSALDGTNGFQINGVAAGDLAGWAVGGTGDFNGDGFDDILVGARYADPNGIFRSGSSYVIFGGSSDANALVSGAGNQSLVGTAADERLIGGIGDDTLDGGAGSDVLIGGAGNDVLLHDAADRRVDGGSGYDALRLTGGAALNLSMLPEGRLIDIEAIDAETDAAANAIVLAMRDVIDITSAATRLVIEGGANDTLVLDGVFTAAGTLLFNGETYNRFTAGPGVTVLVDIDVTVGGFGGS